MKTVALVPQLYGRAVGDNSSLSLSAGAAPCLSPSLGLSIGWSVTRAEPALTREPASRSTARPDIQLSPPPHPQEIDPLYLFARRLEWEQKEEPSAAWDLLAAAQSPHSDTRAHARALIASSHQLGGLGAGSSCATSKKLKPSTTSENNMKSPYGLNIIDDCTRMHPQQTRLLLRVLATRTAGAQSG